MAILIGVDEAGYGPNLGPLVVAATAWRVADEEGSGVRDRESRSAAAGELHAAAPLAPTATSTVAASANTRRKASADPHDLYRRLKRCVVRSPAECAKRVAIADSKALYKSGMGLHGLERGVLVALRTIAACEPSSPSDSVAHCESANTIALLWARTGADPDGHGAALPWHAEGNEALPLDATAEEIGGGGRRFDKECRAAGVALIAVRARCVHPRQFNDLCDEFGTKGAALSHVTLGLVRETVDFVLAQPRASLLGANGVDASQPMHITLDKHGGRNRYAALVQHHFPECWIEIVDEGRAASTYRWRHGETPVEASFRVRGESALPTALASMTAKYHRELAMRQFNAYWTARVPGLAPTAGYPGDAPRFKAAILDEQRRLGVADRILWRNR